MAAFDETARDHPAGAQAANHEGKTRPVNASTKSDKDEDIESSDEDLPPERSRPVIGLDRWLPLV